MHQALATRQLLTGTTDRVLDRGVDLLLYLGDLFVQLVLMSSDLLLFHLLLLFLGELLLFEVSHAFRELHHHDVK